MIISIFSLVSCYKLFFSVYSTEFVIDPLDMTPKKTFGATKFID